MKDAQRRFTATDTFTCESYTAEVEFSHIRFGREKPSNFVALRLNGETLDLPKPLKRTLVGEGFDPHKSKYMCFAEHIVADLRGAGESRDIPYQNRIVIDLRTGKARPIANLDVARLMNGETIAAE